MPLPTRDDLIAAFPEFSDEAVYPTPQITFWLNQAGHLVNEAAFGESYTLAVLLFVAHNISLSAQAAASAKGGAGGIGVSLAPVASKTVGPISKSYDTGLTAYAGAGPWNATAYGQRYYAMLRAFSAGPFYRLPTLRYPGLPRAV